MPALSAARVAEASVYYDDVVLDAKRIGCAM
jgi:hypothetical protein